MDVTTIAIAAATVLLVIEIRKISSKLARDAALQTINFDLRVEIALTEECAADLEQSRKWLTLHLVRRLRAFPMVGATYDELSRSWSCTPTYWKYMIDSHSWHAKETDRTSFSSDLPIASKDALRDVFISYLAAEWRFAHISDDVKALLTEFAFLK